MSIDFNAKTLSNQNKEQIRSEVLKLRDKWINPRLDVILAWDNESAKVYANVKKRIGDILWIEVVINSFEDDVEQKDILNLINNLNNGTKHHWIMIESPVSEHLNYDELVSSINPIKDIDGLSPRNLWNILMKKDDRILPATPLACINILEELVDSVEWLNIVVVWHGRTVWWPLTSLLSNKWATVKSCNHFTKDLIKECQDADVIITATWVPGLINKGMVNENTIVIDAWISVNSEGWVIWDVDYKEVSEVAKYVTPVPGWVWTVTTSIIFKNLIQWIQLQKEKTDPFKVSLEDFIWLSKGASMPWGGGISCISAINGISMISMVYNLTKNLDIDEEIKEIDDIIFQLKYLYIQDIAVFQKYLDALKMHKDTEEEKNQRSLLIQESLIQSCETPLKIAEYCLKILHIAEKCYKVWNPNVLTDVLVWVNLAKASAKSALEPIEMNLKTIKDEDYNESCLKRKELLLKEIDDFTLNELV